MSPEVAELLRRETIRSVLRAYARGVDARDWVRVRNCYHHDAFDDHGVFRGSPDGLVAHFAQQMTEFAGTLHLTGDPDIGPEERGTCDVMSSVLALHWRPTSSPLPHLVVVADYIDRFEHRQPDGWRIARRVVVLRHAQETSASPEPWRWAHLFATHADGTR